MAEFTISINTLCLDPGPLAVHVDTVVRLGAGSISTGIENIEACGAVQASQLFRDAGLSVVALTHRAFGYASAAEATYQQDRLLKSIDLARAVGAKSLCLTSGPRGALSWKEAAARFAAEIQPCVDHARAAGVLLGLEPTSHLYTDVSIVHRLTDLVSIARMAGVGIGLDLFACWMDSDIEDAIVAAAPLCAFVQVSDYVLGDRGLPCRAVPGDGVVPLDRLLQILLSSGYQGPFDLEIIGPRLAAEGREAGLRRALSWLRHALYS